MTMGRSEAATATGVNRRSTMYRVWESGRMRTTRTDATQIEVDPAELFRAFSPMPQQNAQEEAHHVALASASDNYATWTTALEVEVMRLRQMLEAMRGDRDAWRDLAGKMVAALPGHSPTPNRRRPWWPAYIEPSDEWPMYPAAKP